MDSELEGGASEGLGPHGKPQRFYVIGTARTPKLHVDAQNNSEDFADVLHDVPMPRNAVEQIFVDAAINLDDILMQHFPLEPNESAADHKLRAHGEWKKLWRNRAVGDHGLFIEHNGLERTNLRGNGSGDFRWDVRRQKLEETPDQHGHPVDMLTRGKALQRLRTLWNFFTHLNSDLRSFLLPNLNEFEEIGFATLQDDQFVPQNWNGEPFHVVSHGNTLTLSRITDLVGIHTGLGAHVHVPAAYVNDNFVNGIPQEVGADAHHADFAGGAKWRQATMEVFSSEENVTKFRYEFGRGPKPDLDNVQASVLPTETEQFRLPGAGLGNSYEFKPPGAHIRVKLGSLFQKSSESWNTFLDDETYYVSIRDNTSQASANSKKLQIILRDFGHEPKTIWGRSIQGCFLRRGYAAVELSKLLAKQDDDRRQDIKNCLKGFGVTDEILDEIIDSSSQVYDDGQEGSKEETKAFVNIYALVNSDARVCAVLWCQKWDMTKEGAVLEVKATRLFEFDEDQESATIESQPWAEGDTEEFNKIDDGIKHSLYMRAGGSREPQTRRMFFMLELFALAELSHLGFNGVIARIPRSSNNGFAPNFAAMADQAQVMGFQRAVSPALQPNFTGSHSEAAARDAVIAAFPADALPISFSNEALDIFKFRHNHTEDALFGPFTIHLAKVMTQQAYEASRDLSKSFFEVPQPSRTKWNNFSKDAQTLQPFLKAYFAARVYPTASQMLGSYTILHELLKGNHNNLLMAGSIDLSGGSHRMYVLDDGIQSVAENNDDGRLTALEHRAMKIPEEVAWTGSMSDMKSKLS
jgi:hypothetical protein